LYLHKLVLQQNPSFEIAKPELLKQLTSKNECSTALLNRYMWWNSGPGEDNSKTLWLVELRCHSEKQKNIL